MKKYNKKQSGAALIISLIVLIAVSLLAVSGINRSSIETKIVGVSLNRELLFNAALTETEAVLATLNNTVEKSDEIIIDTIKNFTVNAEGKKEFSTTDVQTFDADSLNTSNIVYDSQLKVAQIGYGQLTGESVNSRRIYKMQLNVSATRSNRKSEQESGLELYAINNQQ